MKKVILISVICLFAGLNNLFSQRTANFNPIPSFNVLVEGKSAFDGANSGSNTKKKRDVVVRVSSTSHNMTTGDATVWVVKDYGAVVLGPYTIGYEQQLEIPVDEGNWGVVIKSDSSVLADVWFSDQL
ncbi:MAG: hypothetical protein WCL00_01920 [Bacteroidota bacterium]